MGALAALAAVVVALMLVTLVAALAHLVRVILVAMVKAAAVTLLVVAAAALVLLVKRPHLVDKVAQVVLALSGLMELTTLAAAAQVDTNLMAAVAVLVVAVEVLTTHQETVLQ
jgi:hypothetical protein